MRLVALFACLFGCLSSPATQCDGYVCPTGLVCASIGCVLPEQLASCSGLANNEPCSYGGQDGHCSDGACLPVGCGNEFVTGAEACDDGNTDNGDGCSADCLSDETCGNQYTDVARGETCDDGDHRSQDGCSSACLREIPRWTQRRTGTPGPRALPAMAYDARRGVVVMFGGAGTPNDHNDTWEWNGVHWSERTPVVSPPARNSTSVAYDARRGVVVLFGGDVDNVLFADTWEYDGSEWLRRAPQLSPSPRENAAMAYDAARGVVVLFGGFGPEMTELADTWEYDGTAWRQVTPATSPPEREAAALAYDPARGVIVMFGGRASDRTRFLGDTWTWNGTTWTPMATASSPPKRALHTLAWSARLGALILAGGHDRSAQVLAYSDTWAWNGLSWTLVAASGGPAVFAGAAVYDAARDAIVLFGGREGVVGEPYTGTTRTFTDQWNQITFVPQPGPRSHVATAYDARTGRVVMYGGRTDGLPSDETWEWDGAGWSRSSAGPAGREGAKMVYDRARDNIVLYGKVGSVHETWTRTGTTWTLHAATGPTGSPDASLAYDSEHELAVLVDGRTVDAGTMEARTFTWNGAAWTRAIGTDPPPIDGALAYDADRQRTVLFGRAPPPGGGPAEGENQTWEWDGDAMAWAAIPTSPVPLPRLDHALVYDPVRRRTVMFGGFERTNLFYDYNDTWEWDGTTWRDISPARTPSPRYAMAAAYDEVRRDVVLFGGAVSLTARFADTWTLRYQAAVITNGVATLAPEETCSFGFDADRDGLLGCDDPDCTARCERCGDGVCDPLESCRLCAGDCGTCAPRCGDLVCDAAEACPGDCP